MRKGVVIGLILAVVVIALGVLFFPSNVDESMTGESVEEPETPMGDSIELDYTDVSSIQAKDLIDSNPELIVIDVSPFYDDGHIPGAVNYYVGDGSLDGAISMLDKDAMYLVYCHFEGASVSGAQKLIDAGFTNVYRLESHFSGWVDAGYEVEY